MSGSRAVLLLALTIVTCCGGRSAKVARPSPVAVSGGERPEGHVPPPPRDDGHLPPTATPQRYTLSLRIDPNNPRFKGTTTIEVDVPEPTWNVVLNARDINISRAAARVGGADISATVTLRVARGGVVPEELVLTFARVLPAGKAEIAIEYDGPFALDLAGLYRADEGGRKYAYTQFEVADARRAFPCFDEPGFKTPYDVIITAPKEVEALANSPEISREATADGMVVHTFATSRPLPSYLVAFAVGEFDIVEGRKEPFPIRVVTTKGRGDIAGPALEVAASLVARLADYFSIPYPYPKLDLVAVPEFAAGAMENAGLITFRDTLLLVDPRRATVSARRAQALVIAHELAHQWLGDLVTMKWWDDLWLNEGFATWAEAKVIDAWKPSFGATLGQIAGVQGVMDSDALKSARAVRGPVHSTSEAEEAFDGIAYEKGAAVLRMIEAWLGPEVFRRGVQHYLSENAWKNASSDDLFRALDYVSTQSVGDLASGFLNQSGVPDVLVNWTCEAGVGKVELSESEWRPLGSEGEPRRGWTLPVCVGTDALKGKSCFTLGRDPIVRDVGPGCPAWVHPNVDGAGYYRFVVEGARLLALARGARVMSPMDRLGVVSNAWAEVRQGAIAPSVLFDILPAFDGETNRYVVDQIAGTLRGIDVTLVDSDVRVAFQRWVAARMAARKASLGWAGSTSARPSEGKDRALQDDEERAMERRTVLWVMGEIANDQATLSEAEEYAQRWLRDPLSVPPDTAAAALPLASMNAGAARLTQLRAAATNAKTPEDRALAIRSMGGFDDPALLRKALDLALTDEIKLSELGDLFGGAGGHRVAWPTLYAWEKENWDKLRARLPGSLGRGMLAGVAATMCTAAERDDAREFFVPALQGVEGVKRQLDEALEAAGLCIALREHGSAQVAKYLKRK
ncbi:MAG: M1 family metallopeptidase [Myxococcota bacterium]|nr:M1 family metallopeptidase [Myxococcota bacterium]